MLWLVYCVWDMVKSLEKDENGQYPNAKITDVAVLEIQVSMMALKFVSVIFMS